MTLRWNPWEGGSRDTLTPKAGRSEKAGPSREYDLSGEYLFRFLTLMFASDSHALLNSSRTCRTTSDGGADGGRGNGGSSAIVAPIVSLRGACARCDIVDDTLWGLCGDVAVSFTNSHSFFLLLLCPSALPCSFTAPFPSRVACSEFFSGQSLVLFCGRFRASRHLGSARIELNRAEIYNWEQDM